MADNISLDNRQLWAPRNIQETKMEQFLQLVCRTHGVALDNYHELYAWSVNNISKFWALVWDFTNIIHSSPYDSVIDESISMDEIPEWFHGARLNYAENALWQVDDKVAIIAANESSLGTKSVTYGELKKQVASCADALKKLGVSKGDRVVGYIANCIEAVVAMLATQSIGAIWSSTSPDFGVRGVLDRFTQINPKVIFSVNAVHYNGKIWDHTSKLLEVVYGLPNLEKVIVINFVPESPFDPSVVPKGVTWDEFCASKNGAVPKLEFEQVPFNHPSVILFSSGTTGKPKCLVHSVGGPLIQHKKEHIIHGNLGPDDVVLQYTTTGWMMWNWLLSVLAIGATIVLFDGSPFKPDPLHLWKIVDEHKVTAFGTSAKYLAALEDAKVSPNKHFHFSNLKHLYSTGSPLKPESFDFVYNHISSNILLGSITGGTDIVSLFAGHNTVLPVYRGELQCRGLGMKVECWDESGNILWDERGDLVCTKPFPCMPLYFWNDHDGSIYKKAYFSAFKGIWHHGDFIQINSNTGGIVMLGRSDGTLNPGGVRLGSAEIYNFVEAWEEVSDSLVVGQKILDDERIVMFLKMNPGFEFNDDLVQRLKNGIRAALSPRHVPAVIVPIDEIPYTINGKKVEIAVKRIISGETVQPSESLVNPQALNHFYNIPALKV